MSYCSYYQARVEKAQTWFLVAVLKSFDHLMFDRTIDKHKGIIEFFVPESLEQFFLSIMAYFEQEGIVSDLKKMLNRLITSDEV